MSPSDHRAARPISRRAREARRALREARIVATRAGRLLREKGVGAFQREARGRLIGRVFYGLPLSTAAASLGLNVDYKHWLDRPHVPASRPQLRSHPLISVLVPVYNPTPELLRDAVQSVLKQSYENWELCVVNDASTEGHVHPMLESFAAMDARIRVEHLSKNRGIAGASQRALELATGEFVALLDHDDELAPDALEAVVERLNAEPELDFIYTDEDKKTSRGKLVEPFFKPGWSPFLLRSMNYITHLSVFRTSLVHTVGGFRSGYDGSQDYDLILRVTDSTTKIAHIPRVLYHYRQTPGSAAMNPDAKPYAYDAAVRALEDSLRREGTQGLVEKTHAGYYRISYGIGDDRLTVATLRLGHEQVLDGAAPLTPSDSLAATDRDARFTVICDGRVSSLEPDALRTLAGLAGLPSVGAAGPMLVGEDGRVVCAGVSVQNGRAEGAFFGWPQQGWGPYFGLLRSRRDCLALVGCLLVRTSHLEAIGADDIHLPSPLAELEICARLRLRNLAIICVSDVVATISGGLMLPHSLDQVPTKAAFPESDPYRNPNLIVTTRGVRMRTDAVPI